MDQPPSTNPAQTYEQYFVPAMFVSWAAVLLRYAAPQAGERVLDVACGTGIVARQVAPLVGPDGQVVALDINPGMLAVARTVPAPAGATIDWQEGNALALPFPEHAFNSVLCQHGLQFVPDRTRAVREMRRVLVPSGKAVVIVLQALERHPVFAALGESVARQLNLPVADVMTPFALWDAEELRMLFTTAAFERVDVHAQSITAQFPEPERFVPFTVMSSAAVVPAFAQLDASARAALIENVRRDIAPTLQYYRTADAVTFPIFAHVAVASA